PEQFLGLDLVQLALQLGERAERATASACAVTHSGAAEPGQRVRGQARHEQRHDDRGGQRRGSDALAGERDRGLFAGIVRGAASACTSTNPLWTPSRSACRAPPLGRRPRNARPPANTTTRYSSRPSRPATGTSHAGNRRLRASRWPATTAPTAAHVYHTHR